MRQTAIFSGSSHPALVDKICNWLGESPGKVALGKFKNGETSVEIHSSVRDKNVFIVQSGSNKMNDSVMELLIMINACKGGSSKSVTAVIPYFPYSRQSKKKAHRSAITARMIANLMNVAGVNHVITIDLHASQMQGFFKCPVDNLVAEPLLAKWIRNNIRDWQDGVVVSKNPGGTKRVTSLADALKLSFGLVTTDRRKIHLPASMYNSVVFEAPKSDYKGHTNVPKSSKIPEESEADLYLGDPAAPIEHDYAPHTDDIKPSEYLDGAPDGFPRRPGKHRAPASLMPNVVSRLANPASKPSPLAQSIRPDSFGADSNNRPSLSEPSEEGHEAAVESPPRLHRVHTALGTSNASPNPVPSAEDEDEFTDERARNVITGRLIHGHIVDDNYPSPVMSAMSGSISKLDKDGTDEGPGSPPEHMLNSFMSERSYRDQGMGGSGDATASDDEEEEALKDPELETTITLVGNVRDRPVFIVDDIIDKPGSWIAAAETVVKRGGATKVYCMATHGLFGDDALKEMDACEEIDGIIVTNSFPISEEKKAGVSKLVVLDVSHLLSEAIRRNAFGESISQLFMHID
ncbi:hypothetical protein AAFC00_006457 [Neodothiora populina]|uniref:ribose-phosphate diphosphokinase n=1 Tax=Neodothiora populina TaxID=2781224 RepID=A0ABR3P595_9PEZI